MGMRNNINTNSASPAVMGFAIVVSFAYRSGQLVVVMLWIDPRIRRGGEANDAKQGKRP